MLLFSDSMRCLIARSDAVALVVAAVASPRASPSLPPGGDWYVCELRPNARPEAAGSALALGAGAGADWPSRLRSFCSRVCAVDGAARPVVAVGDLSDRDAVLRADASGLGSMPLDAARW